MKERITQKLADSIKADPSRDTYVRDDGVSGFTLKVTAAGKRVLFLQYRSPETKAQRKLTFPTARVDEARKLAREAAAKIANGQDPQAEKDRAASIPTLAQAFDLFETEYCSHECKPGTVKEYRRMFGKYVPEKLHRSRLDKITRQEMIALMRSMKDKPTQANNVMKMLRAMFAWYHGDGGLLPAGINPAHDIKRYTDRKRSFVFEGDQLYRLNQALDEAEKKEWPPAVAAFRLLLMTGMRREEVFRLTWEEVELSRHVIRLKDAKTGARDVPLGKGAIAVLEGLQKLNAVLPSLWVIPSPKDRTKHFNGVQKLWNRIRTAAGISNVRIHDLRHNFGGVGAATTRSAVHLKGLLGHTQLATTDRYMHLAEAPLHEAADEVNDAIERQMRPQNVVPIGARK